MSQSFNQSPRPLTDINTAGSGAPAPRRCSGRGTWALRAASIALLACACGERAHVGTPQPPTANLPKYPAHAVPLSQDPSYLQHAPAPDFWSLMPYYVGQQDDVSCSLASITMLVNAARRGQKLTSTEPLVLQAGLLLRVNSPVWNAGLQPNGDGVTLDQLAILARSSLRAFGLPPQRVDVTHVTSSSKAALAELRAALVENEANPNDWLLFNFLARSYLGSGDYGHFAPVAAYDAAHQRVLILDPDRVWYEPYWIGDQQALAGMATLDSSAGQTRGYLHITLPADD